MASSTVLNSFGVQPCCSVSTSYSRNVPTWKDRAERGQGSRALTLQHLRRETCTPLILVLASVVWYSSVPQRYPVWLARGVTEGVEQRHWCSKCSLWGHSSGLRELGVWSSGWLLGDAWKAAAVTEVSAVGRELHPVRGWLFPEADYEW